MWILLLLSYGPVDIPMATKFETKEACEKAAAWYNQRKGVNAICIKDKNDE